MAFELFFYKNRRSDEVVSLYQDDGTTSASLQASDVVRFKMYRRDQATPTLDLDSVAATANGSIVTVDELGLEPTAQATITVMSADIASVALGPYTAEIVVVDDSASDEPRLVDSGVVHILQSGGGDVGLT